MLSANGAISVISGGIVEARVAEGVSAGDSDRFSENGHAYGANDLLNFALHLIII
jgi:hypothetical protein